MSSATKLFEGLTLGLIDISNDKSKKKLKKAARPDAPRISDEDIQEAGRRGRTQGTATNVTGGVEPTASQLVRKTLLAS